jgi:outer membrane protein OmpA-like peptidoglycan-associated protein
MEDQRETVSITKVIVIAGSLLLAQGCLATRDWVREEVNPVSTRVSRSETRINQAESQITSLNSRVSGAEGNISKLDGRIGQTDAKAEKALSTLANLRLERKLVVNFRDGANFAINSAAVSAEAKREIDSFLSDTTTKQNAEGSIFLVTGHTDNLGAEEYNYELGRKRAEGVARYLISEKNIDPLRVATVSYGNKNPVSDNKSAQGRAKNRRVEILVYRDGIVSTPPATPAEGSPRADAEDTAPQREALSRR